MKIEFKKILIENFKAIKKLETEFGEKTYIFGANETGKTTFADAISWVLTGKNSLGESQFEFIPIGTKGISPSVTLDIEIDDGKNKKETTLTRTYQAKQNRSKEYTGEYQTVYFINRLKVGPKEYETWIDEHICKPEIFRLIHDVRYFTENISTNGKERPWEVQRRFLFSISGIKPDLDFAKGKKRFESILHGIAKFDTANRYLAFLKKEETTISNMIQQNRSWLENFSDILGDNTNGDNADEILAEFDLENIAFSNRQKEYLDKSKKLNADRNTLMNAKSDMQIQIEVEKAKLKKFEDERNSISFECPVCHQYVPVHLIDLKSDELESEIKKSKEFISLIEENANTVQEELEKIEKEIDGLQPPVYSDRMQELNEKLYWARGYSNAKANIKKTETEISVLLDKRAENSRLMDLCKDFIDAKCKFVENKINKLFDGVSFKLFHQNKTNGEVRDCCEVFWNGVPYESLSYSTKFIVSMKIALAFQKFYKVYMPVIVDNAESIDFSEDIPVQTIMLVKQDTCCPVCGQETGRKTKEGKWICKNCNAEVDKHLVIRTDIW